MAALPDVKLDAIITQHNEVAVILLRGLGKPNVHATNTMQEMHERTGALIVALDVDVSIETLTDEQLARVGLQRRRDHE